MTSLIYAANASAYSNNLPNISAQFLELQLR